MDTKTITPRWKVYKQKFIYLCNEKYSKNLYRNLAKKIKVHSNNNMNAEKNNKKYATELSRFARIKN